MSVRVCGQTGEAAENSRTEMERFGVAVVAASAVAGVVAARLFTRDHNRLLICSDSAYVCVINYVFIRCRFQTAVGAISSTRFAFGSARPNR